MGHAPILTDETTESRKWDVEGGFLSRSLPQLPHGLQTSSAPYPTSRAWTTGPGGSHAGQQPEHRSAVLRDPGARRRRSAARGPGLSGPAIPKVKARPAGWNGSSGCPAASLHSRNPRSSQMPKPSRGPTFGKEIGGQAVSLRIPRIVGPRAWGPRWVPRRRRSRCRCASHRSVS